MKFGFCIQAGDDPYNDRKTVRLWLSLWKTWSWTLWKGPPAPDLVQGARWTTLGADAIATAGTYRPEFLNKVQARVNESMSESKLWDRTFHWNQDYFRPRPHPAMAQEVSLIEWCGIGYFLAWVLPVLVFGGPGPGLVVGGIAAALIVCAGEVGRMKPA